MDDITKATPPSSVIPYVVAAVGVVLISTLAIFGVFIVRPDKDNTALIAIICASITPTSAAILSLMKSQETHMVVNSRFDKVLNAGKAVSRQEGIDDERERQELMRGVVAANKNMEVLREAGSITPVAPVVVLAPVHATRPEGSAIPTVEAPVNVVQHKEDSPKP